MRGVSKVPSSWPKRHETLFIFCQGEGVSLGSVGTTGVVAAKLLTIELDRGKLPGRGMTMVEN